MPQSKPEYEKVKEFDDIAERLVKMYPEILEGVDISLISCVAITNKEPKDGKSAWELKAVPYPIRLDCKYDHYLVVNSQIWNEYDGKHKAMLVFAALCSIDKENPNKTVPFDLRDHSVIVRTVGTDYLVKNDIPDILEKKVTWRTEP
jgi:hypothetical protein